MFDNVIVGVDGVQNGRDAIELARQLASAHAQLTLAYVQVDPRRPSLPSGVVTEVGHAVRVLERLALLRDASSVDARVVCVHARTVAAGLHRLAASRAGDLLVIGASRRDAYERAFVGDDARAVLHNAPCAVAVAPTGYAARPPLMQRIGAAYDGSPGSEHAVALARRIGLERGGQVSAFEAVPEPYVRSLVYPQPEIDEGLAAARERMAVLGDVEAHVASGDDAAEALARFGASVDLLVLGSHRSRLIDHLSGSTAQRLADTAPCPLLVLANSPAEPTTATSRRAAADLIATETSPASGMALWAAVYRDVAAALDDLEALADRHDTEMIGMYDAAVIDTEDATPHIVKHVDQPRVRVIPETVGPDDLAAVAAQLRPGEAALVVVAELSAAK